APQARDDGDRVDAVAGRTPLGDGKPVTALPRPQRLDGDAGRARDRADGQPGPLRLPHRLTHGSAASAREGWARGRPARGDIRSAVSEGGGGAGSTARAAAPALAGSPRSAHRSRPFDRGPAPDASTRACAAARWRDARE